MNKNLNKMRFLHGKGWKEENYSESSFGEILKDPIKDGKILLNFPKETGKDLCADDFESLRGFFVDIDAPASVKAVINPQFDWKMWHSTIAKEIKKLELLFEKEFRKQPTIIYGSGAGIHIVFMFNKPIKRKLVAGGIEQKIATMFRYIEMNMPEWEVDKQIYNAKHEGTLFDRLVLKKMRIPKNGLPITKGKFVDDKWVTKYRTNINNVLISGEFWTPEELVLEKHNFISSIAMSYQNDMTNEKKEAVAKISNILLDQKGAKRGKDKIYNVHCIHVDHMDKNASAVFFQDTGIFYCSGCGYTAKLEDVYFSVTGEELEIIPMSCEFKDLDKYLDKYSKQEGDLGETADMIFHFKLPFKEVTFHLSEWDDKQLRSFCALNLIKGFNTKIKQPVLEKLIRKCELNQVRRVKLVKAGFYTDKIVLSDNFAFQRRQGDKEYTRTSAFSSMFPIPVNWEESENVKKIVELMMEVNDEKYNVTVFSFIFLSFLAPHFEEAFSFHPFVYLYGQKDKGKSAIVSLAQSIITEKYSAYLYGSANTEHVFVSSLINWHFMPILIDEIKSILEKDSLVQNIKAMVTNGGMIRKGKVGKELFDTYLAKANMFITSEFRIRQDPSFFQRAIEINMDLYNINTNKAIKFNRLLRMNKTALLWEMIRFMGDKYIDFYELETLFEKNDLFTSLEAKKRMGALLWGGCILSACGFMESVGFGKIDAMPLIDEYFKNERDYNAPQGRKDDIIDLIFNFISKDRRMYNPLLSRLAIQVYPHEIRLLTTNKILIELGWKNQHELGEFMIQSRSARSALGFSFKANLLITVDVNNLDLVGSLLMLLKNMKTSFISIHDDGYDYVSRKISDIEFGYKQNGGETEQKETTNV